MYIGKRSYCCNCLCFHKGFYKLLQTNKILDMVQLKAVADDDTNEAQMTIYDFDTVKNNVGKAKKAGYQHFLLSPQCFHKSPFLG